MKKLLSTCLPAYRSKETDEIIEGKQSRIFEQAENRLYAQQALLASILGFFNKYFKITHSLHFISTVNVIESYDVIFPNIHHFGLQ